MRDDIAGTVELFDLEEDPGERTNLAGAMPAIRSALAEDVESWQAATARPW